MKCIRSSMLVVLCLAMSWANAGPGTPDLVPYLQHQDNFATGENGVTYTVGVQNIGPVSSAGLITATMTTMPAGLTATAFTGTGWTQTSLNPPTATFAGTLASGAYDFSLILTVNVGAGVATGTVLTPVVTVSGGGETNTGNDSIGDPTTIQPTSITVTNANDSGAGSLRQALTNIPRGGTVSFGALFNSAQTISLPGGYLSVLDSVTVTGPGADKLTLKGTGVGHIFEISNGAATVNLSGMTITGGVSQYSISGGINNNSITTISNCVITGNTGSSSGGIGNGGTLTLNNCTISNNTCDYPNNAGGGIANQGTLTMVNCTISGNTVTSMGGDDGGGFLNYGGTATLTNCTVANNSVGAFNSNATGVFVHSGTVTIRNSIVAGNVSNDQCADVAGTTSGGNNVIGNPGADNVVNGVNGDQVGTSVSPLNPVLAPLAIYGGTIPVPTLALLPGSPAIDAGNNALATGADQRGIARPQNGTVDCGAFESRGFLMAVSSGNNQATDINRAFTSALNVSVSSTNFEPVNGGVVKFTPPASGASIVPATAMVATIASGIASSGGLTANGIVGGPYSVFASASGTATTGFSLTNNAALGITPSSLSYATATAPTNQTITVTGGTTPFTTFMVSNFNGGTTGLTAAAVTANSGAGKFVLSGTPTAAGTATFTVNITDAVGATLSMNYALGVNAALALTPISVAAATAGTATNQTLTVTNGTIPYTSLTVSAFNSSTTGLAAGALTATLATGKVVFSATPASAGTATFTVNVSDSVGATLSQNYSLTVNPALNVSPSALQPDTAGLATHQIVTFTQGTTPYSTLTIDTFDGGTTGLTANILTPNVAAGTVAVDGTPASAGTVSFTVTLTDKAGAVLSKNYSITVHPALTFTPTSLSATAINAPYQQVITLQGGTGQTSLSLNGSFNAGGTGLSAPALTAVNATFNSTPTSAGTVTFTLTGTDGLGAMKAQSYSLNVQPLTITTLSLPNGTLYVPYSQPINVLAAPAATVTFALLAGGFPNGLQINPNTGVISGLPSSTHGGATFDFTIVAQDQFGGVAQQAYSVTMARPTIGVTPATIPSGQVGVAFSQALSGTAGLPGGVYTYALNAGSNPLSAGLTLTSDGLLKGTPTAGGTFSFTVAATDSTPPINGGPFTGTGVCSLTLAPATLALTQTLPKTEVGAVYSQTIAVSGGTVPYAVVVKSGTPPPGLNVNANGTITGTPTQAGLYSFIVTATDSSTGSGPYSGDGIVTVSVGAGLGFASAITAIPNPLNGFEYTLNADIVGAYPALVTWDFGDGSPTATGTSVVHDYAAITSYTVTATVSDGLVTITKTLTVTVNGASLAATQPFLLKTATVAFNFSTHQDTVTLKGALPVRIGYMPSGKTASVSIGGLTKTFTLGATGKGGDINTIFSLAGRLKSGAYTSGAATLSVTLKKQNLFDSLKSLGFTNADVFTAQKIHFPVTVAYDTYVTVDLPSILYTATKDVAGKGKLTRP